MACSQRSNERFALQVSADLYGSREYNVKERFASFWHQVDEVLSLDARSVLEVGPGSGLVTEALRRAGVEVTTIDVDPAVNPDMVGSVTDIPVADGSVDVALCSEVLEHVPWNDAVQALRELRRVARFGVVVSIPDVTPYAGIRLPLYFGRYVDRLRRHGRVGALRLAVRGEIRWRDLLWLCIVPPRWSMEQRTLEPSWVPIPHQPWRHQFDGEHYWELGTAGFPPTRLIETLEDAEFILCRNFRVPEHPWHHFFVLRRGQTA
jgi:SAM-dependent methyltransferase